MPLIQENLDESLNIVQELRRIEDESELPEHDALYAEKVEEIEKAEEKKEEASQPLDKEVPSNDLSEDPESDEMPGSEEPPEEEPEESKTIGDKQTTVATEVLRNDYYDRLIVESIFEEGRVGHTIASAAGQGIKSLSGYAWSMVKDLAEYSKELGLKYGPVVLAKLRKGVIYVLTRMMKSVAKMRVAIIQGYRQKKYSFTRSVSKAEKLLETSKLLDNQEVELVKKEAFSNHDLYKWLKVNNNPSIEASLKSMETLLDFLTDKVNPAIQEDVAAIATLIDHCRRGVRTTPINYMAVPSLGSGFQNRVVHGYTEPSELIDSFVHPTVFPNNTLLMIGTPKRTVIQEAVKSGDISNVTKAYQDSFIVLGVSPVVTQTVPLVKYLEKKDLDIFVERVNQLAKKALVHVEMYKEIYKSSQRLKMSYEHYFSWLTGDDHQKSLHDSMAELIYLKQAYISRVYLPAALDIHDYVAMYINVMLKFAEDNLKHLKVVQNSAD